MADEDQKPDGSHYCRDVRAEGSVHDGRQTLAISLRPTGFLVDRAPSLRQTALA